MQTNNFQKGQSSMMMIVIAVVVIALGGLAFFLTQNRSGSSTTETTDTTQQDQPTVPEANPSQTMDSSMEDHSTMEATGKTVKVEIDGSAFKFTPTTITANQGDTVEVTFTNSGGIHDFVIDEFNVATKQLSAGASETVSFVADKKGTFEFYCSVGNHRQQGMVGTLTVN